MNLRYCMMTAHIDCGETRHAQKVMQDLGITYKHATPQSISDAWWFWGCENVPEELPQFLKPLNDFTTGEPIRPTEVVGWGLSAQDAAWLESIGC